MTARRLILLMLALVVASTTQARAQSAAQQLIAAARSDLDNYNADGAREKLIRALGQTLSPADKTRAFTLLAFAEIGRKNMTAARDNFVAALGIQPNLNIDTLKSIEGEAITVFATAKTIVAANAPKPTTFAPAEVQSVTLALNVFMPRDTLISVDDARYLVGALPTLPSDIISSVTPIDAPNNVVWADTIRAHARRPLAWPLKNSSGQFVPNGRYLMRLQASDSTGQSTRILEYRLAVSRVQADTQALPGPLAKSAFLPETLQVGKRSAKVLLGGGVFAAAAVAAPVLLGNSSLNSGLSSDPMSFAVAGGLAIASAVRFVIGRTPTILSPENARKNREMRDAWRVNRDNIAKANADAATRAGIRVTREGT